MGGTSPEEIARQHAEAHVLLELQPLDSLPPPEVGPAIPLAHMTERVSDLVVVQDIACVTGATYVQSLRQQPQQSDTSTQSTDEDPHHEDDCENENVTVPNRLALHDSVAASPTDPATKAASLSNELLLPLEALAPYWSFRGQVDVTALQRLVQEGYNHQSTPLFSNKRYTSADIGNTTDYWDTIHASVHNVTIQRPSHDQWGIPKIALVFCDDYFHRIYDLPWWTAPDSPFRPTIQAILDVLQIKGDQIVRLLLASLPPGVTIPIHSDSGEWVHQSHRIHVPVLVHNPDQILFRCGPNLERIPTRPGHVLEINNQAWHAVSNCDSDHRVHLILDYVEAGTSVPRQRIALAPGEALRQTRRSVDRALEAGRRPTPSFLILGAQKAGTTSLYEALMQHAWLFRPVKSRETHALDWRWNGKLKTVAAQRNHVQSFFKTQALYHYPSCLTGDSTPSYLIDSRRVIPRLQSVWSHWREMKFFVMLREPMARCESHYAMVTSPVGTPAQLKARGSEWRTSSFEEVLQADLDLLSKSGVIPYWQGDHINQQVYDAFVNTEEEYQAWQRYLAHIPLYTGSYSLVGRSLYALNLLPWLRAMESRQFHVIALEDWSARPESVIDHVWRHLDIPSCRAVETTAKNTRAYESKLSPEWRERLERFFEPQNERLVQFLQSSHIPWTRRWIYSDKANDRNPVE
jgi:hypothetical protein